MEAGMERKKGKGEYCTNGDEDDCMALGDLSRIMAESRDAKQLRDIWRGWRTVSPPMRDKFERFVELANKGAREMGFADVGAMWRSGPVARVGLGALVHYKGFGHRLGRAVVLGHVTAQAFGGFGWGDI